MKKTLALVVVLAAVAAAVYGILRVRALYEAEPPAIGWSGAPAAVGRKAEVPLTIDDGGTGLRWYKVTIEQGPRRRVLLDEQVPLRSGDAPSLQAIRVRFDPREAGMRDGTATLLAEARDHSRRNGGQGNTAEASVTIEVRTQPPQVEILSRQHNMSRGGSAAVAYRVGETAVSSGVEVAGRLFPGHPSPADPGMHVALFAVPHDAPEDVEPEVVAADELGNEARIAFYHRIKGRTFPDETVQVSDRLIQKCRDEFGLPDSLDDVAAFQAVNDTRRAEDHVELARLLARTDPTPRWGEVLDRLPSSKRMSHFAEARTYSRQGRTIDSQRHLGIDLASTANSPVPAGADGVVLFAGDLGIYGTTVILDHGLGLATLYAHLSSLSVAEGDTVTRGRPLGRTGTTGLALGDHLHFGVYVAGVAVDPVEWWDRTWIRARITPKIELWQSGGTP